MKNSPSPARVSEDAAKNALLAALDSDRGVPVGELVGRVASSTRLPKSAVAKALYSMRREGYAKVEEPSVKESFLNRFFSLRNLRFWVLLVVPFAAGLAIIGSGFPYMLYARYLFGTLSVLLIPGLGAIEALYTKKELSELQSVVYGLAVSLVIVILVGVMLNYSPWGISLRTLFTSFFALDVSLLLLGAARRNLRTNGITGT
jgi:hypothetical protein